MQIIRFLVFGLCLAVLLAACAKAPDQRGRVHCPACGSELDALFEKRF